MNTNKKSKSVIGYSVLSYLMALIGAIILSPLGGWAYSRVWGVGCNKGLFLLPWNNQCELVGFLFSYPLLLSVILVLFFSKLKPVILFFLWLLGVSLIILLFIGEWLYLFNIFLAGLIGYLIGRLILKIKVKSE